MLRMQEENRTQFEKAATDLQESQDAFADTRDPATTGSNTTVDFSSNLITMPNGTAIGIVSGRKVNPIAHLPYAPTCVTKVKK